MIQIHHKAGRATARGVSRDAFFFLTNSIGDYLSFPSQTASKYHGWVIREGGVPYKIFDTLFSEDLEPVQAITIEEGVEVSEKRGKIQEVFHLAGVHAFSVRYTRSITLRPGLDVRPIFEFPEWGRIHRVEILPGHAMIEAGFPAGRFFIACISDQKEYLPRDRWEFRSYLFDRTRASPPFERYVHFPLALRGREFSFGVGKNREQALRAAQAATSHVARGRSSLLPLLSSAPQAIQVAVESAYHSLSNLWIKEDTSCLRAGLPWFQECWARDALISLDVLPADKKVLLLREMWREFVDHDFSLPSRPGSTLPSIDAPGWLFSRLGELPSSSFKLFGPHFMNELQEGVKVFSYRHLLNGLIAHGSRETWMDSLDRGPALEIQALALRMCKVVHRLTHNPDVKDEERRLLRSVRKHFWNGMYLKDGPKDSVVRPNIFLAAYIYPELLSPKEWMQCFQYVLPELWLPWGGLASVSVHDHRFHPYSTGEDSQSYHNGDSWFYVNNLAAIVLHRLGPAFRKEVQAILRSSTDEILFRGALGHHGELSSARVLESGGAWAQAWSNASYLELVKELFGRK